MRILIRNPQTQLFYKAPGDWTSQPWDARDFQTEDAVAQQINALGFPALEIIFANSQGQVLAGRLIRVQPINTPPARPEDSASQKNETS